MEENKLKACHPDPELAEGEEPVVSVRGKKQVLRFAQDDNFS
jgi:hypothetical protein